MALVILKGISIEKTPTHYHYHVRAVGAAITDCPKEGAAFAPPSGYGYTHTTLGAIWVGQIEVDTVSEPGRFMFAGTARAPIPLTEAYQ